MGRFIYSLSLLIYRIGITLAAPFSPKARKFKEGRKNWKTTISQVNPDGSPLFWMHCASLGEFEQGRPLLEAFSTAYPGYKTLLTFFSPSGYEIHRNSGLADHVCYLPLDNVSTARHWVTTLSPSLAVFVKYEFWYHYSKELNRAGIPLLSVSSIFRNNQPFFKFYGAFNRSILGNFTHFFVQDQHSQELLESIGISRVTISGDSRFDRVYELSIEPPSHPNINEFCQGKNGIFIVGSAWKEDLEVLIPFINESSLTFIIAPHEINESFISWIEQRIQRNTVRYSTYSQQPSSDVLIIDNVGMLSSLYGHAQYAWVGGAFGKGLHNILEAAVYGIPVFFGNKNYKKFREAVLLEARQGAFPIGTTEELKSVFSRISDPDTYEEIRKTNERIVQENLGATDKIMSYCRELLT